MQVAVIAPPEEVVTLDEAKRHLRVESGDDDLSIAAYLAAAAGSIDGPAGWLGRAIGKQVLELRLDTFPYHCSTGIELPYPPIISVDEIRYRDRSGTEQVMDAADRRLIGTDSPRLVHDFWQSWPEAHHGPETVRIRYTAGYEDVPAPIKQAILLMLGHWYMNREAVAVGNSVITEMPLGVQALLAPFRVWAL
ncbi:phage conserved hypothetical protein, phiE125 gp8 family [Faunimonas pinastri]|uniref:Phage gp6-like head-tail connector protein n=1 Tax=Faunimonas pinastri TaxID=1855383 RepID=A0A1H9F5H2_9HYPH|nr:head-tail connector protein [Faunimonas pinastri]SEQ33226.1 phage conserved hypothetical protein, phiE125 gp8 family [Faunimonas pinastri]